MMAIEAACKRGNALRATLCEIERGVFYVTYPEGGFLGDIEQIYQLGASAAEAKRQVEQSAWARGYDRIIWKDDLTAPLFASHTSYCQPAGVRSAYNRV